MARKLACRRSHLSEVQKMARFLGVECPNCVTLFAVAQLTGSIKAQHQDPMVLEDVDCPHCGVHYPQLTADVRDFEATEALPSLKSGGEKDKNNDETFGESLASARKGGRVLR